MKEFEAAITMLDDLLRPGLRLVVCGTAAGAESARVRAYYAGPGNKFWRTLHRVGLTPRQLAPAEYRSLLEHGIGLTDVAKNVSGNDADLPKGAFDPASLRKKIEQVQPAVLAFNGKKAAEVFLRKKVQYGLQVETIRETRIFVAPSTSGAANGSWDESIWHRLAELVREAPTGHGN